MHDTVFQSLSPIVHPLSSTKPARPIEMPLRLGHELGSIPSLSMCYFMHYASLRSFSSNGVDMYVVVSRRSHRQSLPE